jgi:hypothetical protein
MLPALIQRLDENPFAVQTFAAIELIDTDSGVTQGRELFLPLHVAVR